MSHNPCQPTWSEERTDRLKALWVEGWSASECAELLGGGITRNAVIGRLHRLGLTGMPRRRTRPKGSNAPRLAPRPPKRKPVAQLLKTPEQLSKGPTIGGFTLMDLKHGSCRWPEGDVAPFTYCGAQREEGSSYCSEHHKRAHQRGGQSVIERTFEPTHSTNRLYHFGKRAA